MKCLRFAVIGTLVLVAAPKLVHADAVGYRGVVDVRAETDVVAAEHHHDWSRATEDARLKMITTNRDPFTAENTYSHLRLVDRASGDELFKAPVPALTLLWVSPDSRYVVGLSNIKLWNPYQLVVFDRAGKRLFTRSLTDSPWPSVTQSVTNAVCWYKAPTPKIQLEENDDGSATLTIEDRLGTDRQFRFQTTPSDPSK